MAAEVLTERGSDYLFGPGRSYPGTTMTHKARNSLHTPFPPVVPENDLPAIFPEASPSGDGMPPPSLADTAPPGKKRKSSKPKAPPELRRPASTPHIRGSNHSDTSPLASPTSEKRRNKLGYHRTSVACGHCRRRKIRCLLAADDTTGRCLNCIRLKKECHFFPVDQGQGDMKTRPPLSADAVSKGPPLSANSSPRNSTTSESVDDVSRVHSHQSHQPFSVHSSKQSSELDYSDSPMDGGSFQSPTFPYQGVPDSGTPWGQPTFFSSQNLHEDPNTPQSSSDYWPAPHPPNSAMFQHRGSIPVGLDPQAEFYAPPPAEQPPHAWSSMRSMSVGDASQLQHHLHAPYRAPTFHGSTYPFAFSQGSSMSLPLGAIDNGVPGPSVAPTVLPSQALPQEWNAFANPDLETPVAEHHQPPFAQQWFDPAPSSTQGPSSAFFPSSSHPT